MGFLEVGKPIPWEELDEATKSKIKRDGIEQLIHIWSANRGRFDSNLFWGDEIELNMVHMDTESKVPRLVVAAPEVLEELQCREKKNAWEKTLACNKRMFLGKSKVSFLRGAEWHPEFGNHMIECTPSPPYELNLDALLDVEDSMLSRRLKLQSVLPQDVYAVSLASYPLLGRGDFIYDPEGRLDKNPLEGSVGIPKCLPNPHPRFPTLVSNVNKRRGTKVTALVPAYNDLNTSASEIWYDSLDGDLDRQAVEGRIPGARGRVSERSKITPHPVKNHIYADNFAYGMSQCCLQATFGTPHLEAARHLYDQFVVLAPLLLALSAATPALFGIVSDLDTRWPVLEQTCDCRTEEELRSLRSSRYGHAPLFIGASEWFRRNQGALNNVEVPIDVGAYERLRGARVEKARYCSGRFPGGGRNAEVSTETSEPLMDELLARHFAALWVRDPLVVFSDRINLDNTRQADHFENIQSTNWNTVRFKPPPPNPDGCSASLIGWRVEMRSPDIQLSDFENSAIASVLSVLTMAILKEHWNFYIPMSLCLENMEESHKRNACIKRSFWFPHNFSSRGEDDALACSRVPLRTIFLGNDKFTGILPMLDKFVSDEWRSHKCSFEAVEKYRVYSNYLKQRALGQAPTDAFILRNLMKSHSEYRMDSVLTKGMAYEVCRFAILSGYNLSVSNSVWGCAPVPSALRNTCLTKFHLCASSPVIVALLKLQPLRAERAPAGTVPPLKDERDDGETFVGEDGPQEMAYWSDSDLVCQIQT